MSKEHEHRHEPTRRGFVVRSAALLAAPPVLGLLNRGDLLVLTAFGSGYTWASAAIRW